MGMACPGLWMEHTHILHLQIEIIHSKTNVIKQYNLGHVDLDQDNFYLLYKNKDTLLQDPVNFIRGWICENLVARGKFYSARLESSEDRGIYYISYLLFLLPK